MSGTMTSADLLEMALRVLDENEDEMLFASLVRQIGKRRGDALRDNEKQKLEQVLRRDGAAYILPPQEDGAGWALTEEGRIYLLSRSTETEHRETAVTFESGANTDTEVHAPFNTALIKVDSEQMPIYHAMHLLRDERLILKPEFQRNFIWDLGRQSRLIESILLRIPLPAFYLDATRDNTYLVVDGLQRLSTLDRFCNQNAFKLTELSYLKDLENKRFSDLPTNLRSLITERTKLTVYTILPETPPQVKFLIFRRVNTGGMTLTNQEIRHAIYQGAATQLLQELAESTEFREATLGSVNSKRMDDRECVLRFIAFHLHPYTEFGSRLTPGEPANLDGLLNRTMEELNQLPPASLDQIRDEFLGSMRKARTIFRQFAFRKLYNLNERLQPINKPLFEVWSVLLVDYTLEDLTRHRTQILNGFLEVMQENDFVSAISYGTGSPGTVRKRFQRIEKLISEVLA